MFFEQSSKWKVVCLTKMHLISKNWEGVFDFQYKVVLGQCEQAGLFVCLFVMGPGNPVMGHPVFSRI